MNHCRFPIGRVMVAVVFVALDLAALRSVFPRVPNPGLMMAVLVLEGGLVLAVPRRGHRGWFQAGFQAAGWAYVVPAFTFGGPTFRHLLPVYQRVLGLKPSGSTADVLKINAFHGTLHFLAAMLVAVSLGLLVQKASGTKGAVPGRRSPLGG